MDVEGEILNTTMDVEGGIPATSDTHASYRAYDRPHTKTRYRLTAAEGGGRTPVGPT